VTVGALAAVATFEANEPASGVMRTCPLIVLADDIVGGLLVACGDDAIPTLRSPGAAPKFPVPRARKPVFPR